MICGGCGAETPQEVLIEMVDDVLSSGGDLETLAISECPNCPGKEAGRRLLIRTIVRYLLVILGPIAALVALCLLSLPASG